MKKHFHLIIMLSFSVANTSFSQSNIIPNFRFEEDATIRIRDGYTLEAAVEFAVYDDGKIVIRRGKPVGYGADEVIGFSLKKSGKQFVSGSKSKHSRAQFVEDLTSNYTKLKVVKAFIADEPLIRENNSIVGKWVHYFLLINEDDSKQLMSDFTKLAKAVEVSCPALSKKILSKDKGYFLNSEQESSDDFQTFYRIASEFEQCTK